MISCNGGLIRNAFQDIGTRSFTQTLEPFANRLSKKNWFKSVWNSTFENQRRRMKFIIVTTDLFPSWSRLIYIQRMATSLLIRWKILNEIFSLRSNRFQSITVKLVGLRLLGSLNQTVT